MVISVLEVIRIISEVTMEGIGQTMEGNQTDECIHIVRAAQLPMESRGRGVGISMPASRAISNVDIQI